MEKYSPEHDDPSFASIRTFMRLPNIRSLGDDVDFAIVGLPFDTGSSGRIGSRFAPEAIRSASVSLGSYNIGLGISIFDHLGGVDYGDVKVVPGFIEESLKAISDTLSLIHQTNTVPIGIGGDHSVVLGELRAAAQKYGPLGLVLFDSHHDCWDSYQGHKYFHSTIFRRAIDENLIDLSHSIMCGLRGNVYSLRSWSYPTQLGVYSIPTLVMRQIGMKQTCEEIVNRVGNVPVFLSFDMDFIDPAYAPGVGTPEIGGFTTWEALELLRGIRELDIKAADLVEVIPVYDNSQLTSITAANIIFEMLSLLAWRKSSRNG